MKILFLFFLSSTFFSWAGAIPTEPCEVVLFTFPVKALSEPISDEAQSRMLTVLRALKDLREENPTILLTMSEGEVNHALEILASFERVVNEFKKTYGLDETSLGKLLTENVTRTNASPIAEQLRELRGDFQVAHARLQFEFVCKALTIDPQGEESRAGLEALIEELSGLRPRFAFLGISAPKALLEQIDARLFGGPNLPNVSDEIAKKLDRLRGIVAHLRARGPRLISTEATVENP